jgi:site-specific recombinase XerD
VKGDPTEKWLGMVSYSKSRSTQTTEKYRNDFTRFLTFTNKTADEIINEYWNLDPRRFKAEYKNRLENWILSLQKEDKTTHTIKCMAAAVQSFFKYNDLPLGRIPQPRTIITYHNRDITRDEIAEVFKVSKPRNRAFYAVMTQSGLRPHTICHLQLKHLELDRFEKGEIPVKIQIPQIIAKGKFKGYWSFIDLEATEYLQDYLKTRPNINPESWLFAKYGRDEASGPKNFSHDFNRTVRTLKAKGILDFEERPGKPAELRLYNLRKFFNCHASSAGHEYKEIWMGHSQGVVDHYISRDVGDFEEYKARRDLTLENVMKRLKALEEKLAGEG